MITIYSAAEGHLRLDQLLGRVLAYGFLLRTPLGMNPWVSHGTAQPAGRRTFGVSNYTLALALSPR